MSIPFLLDSTGIFEKAKGLLFPTGSTNVAMSGGGGSTGDVLTKQNDGTAAWATPSTGGTTTTKAVGSDTSSVITAGSTLTKTISVGTGLTACLVFLSTVDPTTTAAQTNYGAVLIISTTATDNMGILGQSSSSYMSAGGTTSTYLTGVVFNATPGSTGIFVRGDSVYNSSTGNLSIVFKNDAVGSKTLTAYWTVLGL